MESTYIPHSLLFVGPLSSAKEKEALEFAHQLCAPPDLYLYHPEGKLGLHSIDTLRLLREEVYLPPYKSLHKVFIIYSADRMLPASANTLLKTFEEPLETSKIILISSHPEKLLPTVRSRCQCVYFQEGVTQSEKFMPLMAPLLSHLPSAHPIEILETAARLAEVIEKEAGMKLVESEKEETRYQKAKRENEEEGQEALKEFELIEALTLAILRWFRDLHAVYLALPKKALFQPEYYETLQQKVDQGAFPNLDKVQGAVEKAKRTLSRNASLKHVLENLFYDLRFV